MTNSRGRFLSCSAAMLALVLCSATGWAQLNPGPVNAPPPAAAVAPQSQGASSVRIVRLSQVVGSAQMDRGIDRGFETAFTNLPITQGARLLTGEGAAEVEFEDNSSLRMTPNTLVEFTVLSLGPNGTRISTIRVRGGTVYVSLAKNRENSFTVLFGKETLTLAPAAHIELVLTPTERRLDVLDGRVQAANGATTTEVDRKKALLFGAGSSDTPTLVSKNEKGPYDAWDKQAVEYHSHYASASHYASTPYAYGLADMNYYGSFSTIGGCGSMWRPYLASANWSPYANGTWAYYSGAGYSFVSPYPWGWTPYHSGSWDYCPTGGWGWRPDNQWNGLQNMTTAAVKAPLKAPGSPRQLKPPHAPLPLEATLVPVHEGPVVVSKFTARDTFLFRNDSAGLGVPRGSFGKLAGISSTALHQGAVERAVYLPSVPTGNPGSGTPGQRNASLASPGSAGGTSMVGNSGAFAGSRSYSSPAMSAGGGSFGGGSSSTMSAGGGHFGGVSGGMGSSTAGSSAGHH